MPTTGSILKAARERAGLNQRQLAVKAFKNKDFQSLISRYEAGQLEPSLRNLRKLAGVLGLSLGDFTHVASDAQTPEQPQP